MGHSLAEIIIIDDDPYFLEYLETLVSRWGFKARAFHEPTEALKRLGEFPPRLLMTDLYMPQMNGIEVLKAVRDAAISLPVIVLSGQYEEDGLKLMQQLGAAAMLLKPLDSKKLHAEILRLIQDAPARIDAE